MDQIFCKHIIDKDWGSEDLFQRTLVKRTLGQRTFFKGPLVQKDLLARGPFPKDLLNQRDMGKRTQG